MADEVLARIEARADELELEETRPESEAKLSDETARVLKDIGIVRELQPKAFGGYEADPREFFNGVMAIGSKCGPAGWLSGIIGVHPWELALFDPEVQREVWGDDVDTWIASSYAPMGKATPVDGGFRFSGRWSFASGVDHAEWLFLGGLVVDDEGKPLDPPDRRDFLIPKRDYTIVPDSWQVVGLSLTGSKDVIVDDVFVPTAHTLEVAKFHTGKAAAEAGCHQSLYRMPWSVMFPNAITAAVIGIAEGALAAHVRSERERSSFLRGAAASDPHGMAAIGEAASEIHACRTQLLANVGMVFDMLENGAEEIPFEVRVQARRDQVRGSWRAVEAVDRVFANAGGGAIRASSAVQRKWRDAHAGLNHVINNAKPVYHVYAATMMGTELPAIAARTPF
jgi:alkylation response protein AidB-like acyl-CoA dehydrogenase